MQAENPLSRRTFVALGCAALAQAADPVIDIHQHTNYSGRTDQQLLAHQPTMGITKTVLLPAGRTGGLAAGAGGNDTVVALSRAHPGEYVFFANELPDIPETKKVIEKYLKAVLQEAGLHVPRTHDLPALLALERSAAIRLLHQRKARRQAVALCDGASGAFPEAPHILCVR